MASRIQGITVEIGGDTTKLSTALSKVNKEIRDTQAQLKAVEAGPRQCGADGAEAEAFVPGGQ